MTVLNSADSVSFIYVPREACLRGTLNLLCAVVAGKAMTGINVIYAANQFRHDRFFDK